MTAASSPWMIGSCKINYTTVDRIVEELFEDPHILDLHQAFDLACFVKNIEINKTGFSSLQLFTDKSPSFPGYSDCTPGSIVIKGNNEYIRVLTKHDETRIAARKDRLQSEDSSEG